MSFVLFCVAASHPSRFTAAGCFPSQSFNEVSLVNLHRHMFASHCLLFATPPLIFLLLYLGPVALGITSWQVTSNWPAAQNLLAVQSGRDGRYIGNTALYRVVYLHVYLMQSDATKQRIEAADALRDDGSMAIRTQE